MVEILKGSVKDLLITNPPTDEFGIGIFEFSDRYSVFDWGEMPDHIKDKGTVLAMIGAANFEMLEKQGIKTHYIGMRDKSGFTRSLQDLLDMGETSNQMIVKIAKKIPIDNNYAQYKKENPNYLIPLEIIFRNGLPKGSSIFRKIKAAKEEGKLEDLLFSLGLNDEPKENHWLDNPIYDFSTKLEETDRPLSYEEALRISGLSLGKFGDLLIKAEETNNAITKKCESLGLEHWDGKIEAVYKEGEIYIADVCGTLDESRISINGKQLSKEPMRQYYKKSNWYGNVVSAKKIKSELGKTDWKKMVITAPEKLPEDLLEKVENMYKATLNHWMNVEIYNVPKLHIAVKELDESVESYK